MLCWWSTINSTLSAAFFQKHLHHYAPSNRNRTRNSMQDSTHSTQSSNTNTHGTKFLSYGNRNPPTLLASLKRNLSSLCFPTTFRAPKPSGASASIRGKRRIHFHTWTLPNQPRATITSMFHSRTLVTEFALQRFQVLIPSANSAKTQSLQMVFLFS